MNDLITNINQATSDFNGIKQAIINKGVTVPQGTHTSQYAELINSISGGGGGSEISGFNMRGVTAYFTPENIDIPNLQWINSIENGGTLTFTAGELLDNSLMIPGNENGQFPLEENPEVVYLVVKKPIMENDKIFFGAGATSTVHGKGLELGQGWQQTPLMFDTFGQPYVQVMDVDINKWHLLTAVKDFKSINTMLCFCDGKFYGQIPTLYNSDYIGHLDLNRIYRQSSYYYQCVYSSYFKFIVTGSLPTNENEPLNYMFTIYNNMNWIMKNIVNPANEE